MPNRTIDSIVAGAALVTQLQSIVSRSVNPLEPAVLSVGTIQGDSPRMSLPSNAGSQGQYGHSTRRHGI